MLFRRRRAMVVVLVVVAAWSAVVVGVLSAAVRIDPARLPLGDGRVSTAPERGAVWSCRTRFPPNAIGASANGAWIHDDGTWDATAKIAVQGAVAWPEAAYSAVVEGETRAIVGNDLPTTHPTGTFPIAPNDPAYRIDRNPNRIAAQLLRYALPTNPTLAAEPSCVPMGAIGFTTTGVVLFNALDAGGKDAVAHEVQDGCHGHPEIDDAYHYHDLFGCVRDAATPSGLLGYAFDGFGIFAARDETGVELTNADLDECHGRTGEIEWDGVRVSMYHYVATREYPYTVGCFRGTSAVTPRPMPPPPMVPPPIMPLPRRGG